MVLQGRVLQFFENQLRSFDLAAVLDNFLNVAGGGIGGSA